MDTFGLTETTGKSLDDVNAQLDAMGQKIFGVYGDVQQSIRDQIDGLAYRVGNVDRRVRASLNGHMREMQNRLSGPLNAIRSDLNNALDSARGQVNLIAVQHAPDIPSVPLPPLSPGQPSELARVYSVLANRDCSQFVAVPGDLGDWYAMGWVVPDGWLVQGQVTAAPADVPNILIHWQQPCKTVPPPQKATSA